MKNRLFVLAFGLLLCLGVSAQGTAEQWADKPDYKNVILGHWEYCTEKVGLFSTDRKCVYFTVKKDIIIFQREGEPIEYWYNWEMTDDNIIWANTESDGSGALIKILFAISDNERWLYLSLFKPNRTPSDWVQFEKR